MKVLVKEYNGSFKIYKNSKSHPQFSVTFRVTPKVKDVNLHRHGVIFINHPIASQKFCDKIPDFLKKNKKLNNTCIIFKKK